MAGPPPKTTIPRGALGHQTKNHIILTGSNLLGCNQVGVHQWISARSRADKSADSPASAVGRRGTWPDSVQTERGPLQNNQGRQARKLETEKPDNWLNTLAGRSYDEIRAFFYDQQVNKMKAQGTEFGA
ncbi:hypothetical protein SERLA73DRAFT_70175 [Serpula lacrymans var. lacrymans S7.3]|uniref:Uncharacterized protein n=2 Tax=Serpula lacrymans var. lacrymans TaxID=341189 RepID=F8PM60_SERL3|nr:uncharacterized protein SERLADRAFT_434302 [Serpula lacrymans var. lacrymans S7.9]EGO02692.1 hypothetical protein SERLA73DRAFT_70175 [Serpula lacrymans var. lacrymans S7.3]EGO28391.1 hypothetical protein SERLADRAFT_434302 [Serpula lacrymans var. lacrymans S7.9]